MALPCPTPPSSIMMGSEALATGSQITLVNPDPPIELVFSKFNSMLNNNIFINGRPHYKIVTIDPHTTITDVQTNELLVRIKRRTLHADAITFTHHYGGNPLKLKQWVVDSGKTLEGYRKWTIETPLGVFVWRIDPVLRLSLCPGRDLDHPVAWVQLPTGTLPFALLLKRGTEGFRDQILASFIILEQLLRLEEKVMTKARGYFQDPRIGAQA
ncbi:hypothetical protein M413DRAFT_23258 [Hebeloma cylindrosporum]|uniref:DUF6593 domain-containing protein n=1 Tax=Hebeloma cylindrosporum TaxID=76867 RepID=A0A0C2Z183_HEBCY|nr:hypothetical protein M413DRAFT_23258 [Hebeloma cylindrosporum h7]